MERASSREPQSSFWAMVVLGRPGLARLHPFTRVLAEAARLGIPLDEACEAAGGPRLFGTRSRLLWCVLLGSVNLLLLVPLLVGALIQNGELRSLYRRFVAGIRSGRPLADVVDELPELFPRDYRMLVRAGQVSSDLAGALRLAEEVTRAAANRRKGLSLQLSLAALTLTVLAFVTFILRWKVFPTLLAFHAAIGQEEPLLTRVFLRGSSIVGALGPVVILPAIALLALFAIIVRGTGPLRAAVDWLRLVLLRRAGGISESSGLVFGMTALLLKGGIPLPEAFRVASKGFRNSVLERRYLRFADDLAVAGRRVVVPSNAPFDAVSSILVSLAIPGGELPRALQQLSRRALSVSRAERRRVQTLLGPALTLGVGVLVGIVVISLYRAIAAVSGVP